MVNCREVATFGNAPDKFVQSNRTKNATSESANQGLVGA